jgi:hypothetical protein
MEQVSSSLFFLFSFFLLSLRVRARLTRAAALNLTSGERTTIPCNQSINQFSIFKHGTFLLGKIITIYCKC